MQYAAHGRYQIFAREHPSVVILQSDAAFYAIPTPQLVPILKKKTSKETQLFGLSKLLQEGQHEIERFRCPDVCSLYLELVKLCAQPRCSAPMSEELLFQYVPRPGAMPEVAQQLGSVVAAGPQSNNKAGPKSAKGIRKPRTTGKEQKSALASGGNLGEALEEQTLPQH
jgi:hypothetical protein